MKDILIYFLAYLIGSVTFGLWIGKWKYKMDIREHGSGNLGATNTFRVLGKKAGFTVFILDMLKGTLAASLPFFLHSSVNPLIPGILAVIGHSYPLFAGFRGGKAVATTAGILLYVSPLLFGIGIVGFIILLLLTQMVSLSSIFISIIMVAIAFLLHEAIIGSFLIFFALFIIYRHRSNIKRIWKKEEPKINIIEKLKKRKDE